MRQVIFLIPQRDFNDSELLQARAAVEPYRLTVVTASATRRLALGQGGTEVHPQLALPEIASEGFAGLVLIGGRGVSAFRLDPMLLELVRQFHRLNRPLGAISTAVAILGNAGVLMGRRVTGFSSEEQMLRSRGAEYTGMPVEVDGNIITAKDPTAAAAFGHQVAKVINGWYQP